jgi:hypothetical protein
MDLKIKFERGFIKPDRKSLLILGVILLIAVLVTIGLFYYFNRESEITTQEPPKDPMKEIIKSLTAPSGERKPISEEIQENLSAPAEKESSEVSEDILKSLTAPK